MEENIRIEISETNRGKKQIIINGKYKFNFSNEKKDNSKVYIDALSIELQINVNLLLF